MTDVERTSYYGSFLKPIIEVAETSEYHPTLKVFSNCSTVKDSHHFDVTAKELKKILAILEEKDLDPIHEIGKKYEALVKEMNSWGLYQIDDQVGMALTDLRDAINNSLK